MTGLKHNELSYKLWKNGDLDELRRYSDLRVNLFSWIPFSCEDKILIVGDVQEVFLTFFSHIVKRIVIWDPAKLNNGFDAEKKLNFENADVLYGSIESFMGQIEGKIFDYVIFTDGYTVYPYENINEDIYNLINLLLALIKERGKILIAASNALGMKYWSGCRDETQNSFFAGIEGYVNSIVRGLPSYKNMLALMEAFGSEYCRLYYPYPDIYFPMSIYSDKYLPKKNELTKNAFSWEKRLVNFNELNAWNNIIKNGLFREFSNGFLFIYSRDKEFLDTLNIYTKFSNDRDEKYLIRTDIFIGKDRKKHIKKVPTNKESKKHLLKMKESEKHLNDLYREKRISINAIISDSDGIEFEYLEGYSFAERLESLLTKNLYDEFLQEFSRLTDVLIETSTCKFEYSEEFKIVFGDVDLPAGLMSSSLSNIDLILTNLICTDSELTMIDYEWVFDFYIPVNFIIYRSIDYLFRGPRGNFNFNPLYRSKLLDIYDIDEEQVKIYELMENNFQTYVRGSYIPIRMMNVTVPIANMQKTPRVYFDFGKGFSGKNSFFTQGIIDINGYYSCRIAVPCNTRKIRIDPSENYCIVQVINISSLNNPLLQISSNGKKISDNVYLFKNRDSQFYVNGTGNFDFMYIDVELIIRDISEEMCEALWEISIC